MTAAVVRRQALANAVYAPATTASAAASASAAGGVGRRSSRLLRTAKCLSSMPLYDVADGSSLTDVAGTAEINGSSSSSEIPPAKSGGGGGGGGGNNQHIHRRPIYVSATKQHTGKTTTSLAIMSGLIRRFGPSRVGFIKPVGQQCLPVTCPHTSQTLMIDKDAVLVKRQFDLSQLDHLDGGGYGVMSPLVIGSGYTRDYVDGKVDLCEQRERIRRAYRKVADVSDVVLCEGTGHCAVGSVVGASNAQVAKDVGADMVLVANGGLGSTFDELELNRTLCTAHGVNIAGVIVNKVQPAKYDVIRDYLSRALMQAWDIPLLGCIPDRPFLGCPALADFERLFGTRLIGGGRHRFRHYRVPDIYLVTTSLKPFLENMRSERPGGRTLYVSHVTRDDIILGFLGEYVRRKRRNLPFESALLLCGREGKYQATSTVMDIVNDPVFADDVPIMIAGMSTHDAMERMHSMTPKLNVGDVNRVGTAVEHYEPYIDFDLLLERTSSSLSRGQVVHGSQGRDGVTTMTRASAEIVLS